jgi:hypothetical protein
MNRPWQEHQAAYEHRQDKLMDDYLEAREFAEEELEGEEMEHTEFKQNGTLIHDADHFICQLLDGSSWSSAKPLNVGDPNWKLMMEYAAFIVTACNSHWELLEACKVMRQAMTDYEMDVDECPPQRHVDMMRLADRAIAKAGA